MKKLNLEERLSSGYQPGDIVVAFNNRWVISGIQRDDGYFKLVHVISGEERITSLSDFS